jgi:hypothetical protein
MRHLSFRRRAKILWLVLLPLCGVLFLLSLLLGE